MAISSCELQDELASDKELRRGNNCIVQKNIGSEISVDSGLVNRDILYTNLCFARKLIKNDSLIIQVGFDERIDSIWYNNPYIQDGYCEFALNLVFRNQFEDKLMDNIVVNTTYYPTQTNSQPSVIEFQNFFNLCNVTIFREYALASNTLTDYNTEPINIKFEKKFIPEKNTFELSASLNDLCSSVDKYFSGGFLVITTFNYANIELKNNFKTDFLNSDPDITHYFFENKSRVIEERSNPH